MMQDPITAKIVSRDARDFARNNKIKKQNNSTQEVPTMAINEKTLKKIRKDFDKHNERVLKIYRRNGDKSLLELLYLNSDNPEEVAEEFGISIEDATDLIEKDKAAKADPIGTMEAASKKAAEAIGNILGRKIEESDDTENSEDDSDDEEYDEDSEDDSDDDFEDDSDDDFDLTDLLKKPEKIIEGLCFIGEVIQDTSEKICDALDESADRIMEHDFDD